MYYIGHHKRKLYISQAIGPGWLAVGGRKGKCVLEGGRQEGHVHLIGDRWRVVCSQGQGGEAGRS